MLVGGLDLSVGANVLLSSVIIADLVQRQQQPLSSRIAAGVAAATGVGLINGVLTAVIGIEPILATLGTLLLAGGHREGDPRTAAGSSSATRSSPTSRSTTSCSTCRSWSC